ncbi:MAG: glycine cleavage system protein H [bacterium]
MVALVTIGIIIGAIVFDIAITHLSQALRMRRLRNSAQHGNASAVFTLPSHLNMRISPGMFHYHGHTWLQLLPDGRAVVGMNDLLHRIIGRIDEIHPTDTGKHLRQGEKAILIRQGEKLLFLTSPVSGSVIETNSALRSDPALSKQDPYNNGWLFVLNPRNLEIELPHLMVASQAEQWLHREISRIRLFFEDLLHRKTPLPQQNETLQLEGILEKMDDETWILFKDLFIYQWEWRG